MKIKSKIAKAIIKSGMLNLEVYHVRLSELIKFANKHLEWNSRLGHEHFKLGKKLKMIVTFDVVK